MLSETRTTEDILDFELHLSQYNLIRCDSNSRHTGGVLIYVKSGIEYKLKRPVVLKENYWFQFIEVKISGQQWVIGGIYHSPSSSHRKNGRNIRHLFW